MTNPVERAVVAMSGGQDSTTCLAWALDRFGEGNVHAVSFNYGQRHQVELAGARAICERWGVPQILLSVGPSVHRAWRRCADERGDRRGRRRDRLRE
jgi:7-cyano-7-deazaguanine synthase